MPEGLDYQPNLISPWLGHTFWWWYKVRIAGTRRSGQISRSTSSREHATWRPEKGEGGVVNLLEQGSGDTVRNSKAESTWSVEAADDSRAGSKDFGVHAGCRAAYRERFRHTARLSAICIATNYLQSVLSYPSIRGTIERFLWRSERLSCVLVPIK